MGRVIFLHRRLPVRFRTYPLAIVLIRTVLCTAVLLLLILVLLVLVLALILLTILVLRIAYILRILLILIVLVILIGHSPSPFLRTTPHRMDTTFSMCGQRYVQFEAAAASHFFVAAFILPAFLKKIHVKALQNKTNFSA